MKKEKVALLLTTAFSVLSFCAGCSSSDKEPDTKSFEPTGTNIIENGASSYSVVLPADATSEEQGAADELVTYLYESSGVTLPVVADNTVDINLNGKYISVGDTEFVTKAGIVLDREELGESGYIMKTVNNCLLISGVQGTNFYGSLYGVYDFLTYTIGYEAYSVDEIIYEEKDTVPLLKFDENYRPSFDIRCLEYRNVKADRGYEKKLRLNHCSDYWCSFTHTLISTYLPYSTYGESHPEYYGTTGGTQLCYSDAGCFNALVEAVKSRLTAFPDTEYCMLGQEDNWDRCTCPGCTALMEEFKTYGGVELDFTNRVGRKVDEWLHQAYPGRKVTYVFFAYNSSIEAPVDYNQSSGKRTKRSSSLEVYDNTGVMIAPISYDFAKPVRDVDNQSVTEAVDNWSWLFDYKNAFIWTYSIQSYSNFFFMPYFGVQNDYYRYYESIGTKMLYDQGPYQMNSPSMQAMRVYIMSKLMWNTENDFYDLAYDFISHYYGPAASDLKEYFDFNVAYYSYLRDAYSVNGKVFMMIDDVSYWPMSVAESMLDILDRGLEAIKPLQETDSGRYNTLYDRIQFERLCPLYILLNYYLSSLSEETKEAYLDDFEYYTTYYEVKGTCESVYDVSDLIETWRSA